MLKKIVCITALLVAVAANAQASEHAHPKQVQWHFDGVTGTFDRQSIQRGFQVYKEVCAACHSLNRVAYRDLQSVGFSAAEVKAIAAEKNVTDGPNEQGEMFQRPAMASDHFVPPYPNENASRASNNGAYPPDLSLLIKARHDGANYVHAILTGFGHPLPKGFELRKGLYYNPYFPGEQIAMPPPLTDGAVTYADGTKATVEQMSRDVVNFMQWAAEPEMEHRKQMGIKVIIYLGIFTLFFYVAKLRIWKKLKQKTK